MKIHPWLAELALPNESQGYVDHTHRYLLPIGQHLPL